MQSTVRSLAHLLGLEPCGSKINLKQTVVNFGAEKSFVQASERLEQHHQLKLSESTVCKITLQHALNIQQTSTAGGRLSHLSINLLCVCLKCYLTDSFSYRFTSVKSVSSLHNIPIRVFSKLRLQVASLRCMMKFFRKSCTNPEAVRIKHK